MASEEPFGRVVLELDNDGPGGFYRVRNRQDEINRPAIINRGDKFQVIADLVEVTHGELTPGGDPGAIIVVDFQFIPRLRRRYRGATIKFMLESDDPSVEVSVEKIAPHGHWTKHATTRDDSSSWSLKPSVEPPGVGGISLGELSSSGKQTKTFHTTVDGTMRLETRDEGGKDTARWVLGENEAQSTGIARSLRVAMLVRLAVSPNRKTDEKPKFKAAIEAVADVPFWSKGWVEEKAETFRKKVPVDDPVLFKHGVDRKSGLFSFDKTNLLGEDLTKVMAMSLYESFESLDEAKAKENRDTKEKEEDEEEQRDEES